MQRRTFTQALAAATLIGALRPASAASVCKLSLGLRCTPLEAFQNALERIEEAITAYRAQMDGLETMLAASPAPRLEQLQGHVRGIAGDLDTVAAGVASDGKLEKAVVALANDAEKWKIEAKNNTNIPAAQRAALAASWDEKIERTKQLTKEVANMRAASSKAVAVVSGCLAMIEQYAALKQSEPALKAIPPFLADMKTAAGRLQKSLEAIKAQPMT